MKKPTNDPSEVLARMLNTPPDKKTPDKASNKSKDGKKRKSD